MGRVTVREVYSVGNVVCKQHKKIHNEDRETKRQRDMFDGNSVERALFAAKETKRPDAQENIKNKHGNASSFTSILSAQNAATHKTWNGKAKKSKTDVPPGMRVCKPLQRLQPSEIKRRPRQRKRSLAAASRAMDGDAGNNKHAAARHLPLLELQPALPQSRERVPSRSSRVLQLLRRARV